MHLTFFQSWLPENEPAFHPGTVQIELHDGILRSQADLNQPKVGTSATAHQQRLWELGDVVELFVQQVGTADYYEYQIAPNGCMLALHYPDQATVAAVRRGERKMEEYLCDLQIEGKSIVTPNGWSASLSVPISGEQFRVNCGRYDYSSGFAPVVSSTAPLTKRDFHRLEEWHQLTP